MFLLGHVQKNEIKYNFEPVLAPDEKSVTHQSDYHRSCGKHECVYQISRLSNSLEHFTQTKTDPTSWYRLIKKKKKSLGITEVMRMHPLSL